MNHSFFRNYALLMCACFAGGVAWSMCAIVVMRNQTHVVAGVGLIGLSAVTGVGSCVRYLIKSSPRIEPIRLHATAHHLRFESHAARPNLVTVTCTEGSIVHIATWDDSPCKVVLFETQNDDEGDDELKRTVHLPRVDFQEAYDKTPVAARALGFDSRGGGEVCVVCV